MRSTVRRTGGLLVGLLATASLGGCAHDPSPAAAPPLKAKAKAEDPIRLSQEECKRLGVSICTATVKNVPEFLEAAGVVKADSTMTMPVLSLVPGRAENVFVQIGDQVRSGQQLATIRSDEVAQIEAELLQKLLDVDAEETQLQVRQSLARKTLKRKQLLWQERIAAKADVEAAECELQVAEAAMKSSEAKKSGYISAAKQRLELFGISAADVDKIIATKTINHIFKVNAPRSGIITEREIDPGEAVEPSHQMFTISDLRKVWVVAQIFERDIQNIQRGMPAEATVQGAPSTKFAGHINFIDSRVDPQTRTVSVRATIDNPLLKLKPEMFATLNLRIGETHGLFVPERCLQRLGESDIVYVEMANNTFAERKVKVGARYAGNAQILSGLAGGDQVVADGSVRLLGKIVQRISR